jgi:hypothetical protein
MKGFCGRLTALLSKSGLIKLKFPNGGPKASHFYFVTMISPCIPRTECPKWVQSNL